MQRNEEKLTENLPHYCYLITNTITNKVYVGVTYKDINKRFKEHIKVAKSKTSYKCSLQYSMAKYGTDKFKIELLETFSNFRDAYNAEKEFIKKYDSYKSGYNETDGGEGGPIKLSYNKELIIKILNQYCNGISLKEIAKQNNISRYSVFDITRFRFSDLHIIPQELIDKVNLYKKESSYKPKVTQELIVKICNDFLQGLTMQTIADNNNLCVNNIWNILHRRTWKNIIIDKDLEQRVYNKLLTVDKMNLSKDNVINLIKDYINGNTIKQLMCKYNLSETNVRSIVNRKTWKNIKLDNDLELKLKEMKG